MEPGPQNYHPNHPSSPGCLFLDSLLSEIQKPLSVNFFLSSSLLICTKCKHCYPLRQQWYVLPSFPASLKTFFWEYSCFTMLYYFLLYNNLNQLYVYIYPLLSLSAPPLPSHPSAAAAAKSLQSHPTLCHPIDGSPPGSSVPGILQARTLEWVAISFSPL